ncbi:MAG: helix-turn-helix transcriptional regulator [Eubacteriales bacterium]|nr:helix-turn-helix transcriptional regulator [Eubacteriales bacterium]
MIETITLGNFEQETVLSDDCIMLSLPEGPDVGAMTLYTVFPGITVMYNDFHTDRCATRFSYASQMISIDHCREGRIEWERPDGRFCYLGERDLQLSADVTHIGTYGFPTGHYHGITILFELEQAREGLRPFQDTFSIDLDQIYRRFCQQGDDFILRGDDGIEHLFAELYVVQGTLRMSYLRLKVLELLLYLSRLDMDLSQQPHSYFQRSLVEKVRCIRQELCSTPNQYVTLSELAERYQVSESAMKRCFRAMYGDSIYSFLKKYRLQTSQTLLRSTDLNITEVAVEVGYENTSKYIAAFKKQFGITPAKYRSSQTTK